MDETRDGPIMEMHQGINVLYAFFHKSRNKVDAIPLNPCATTALIFPDACTRPWKIVSLARSSSSSQLIFDL